MSAGRVSTESAYGLHGVTVRSALKLSALITAAALLALAPVLIDSGYWLRIANNAAIMMILVFGLDFVWGRAGQLSFAQAGFFAVGAYTSALLSLRLDLPVLITIGLGGAACVVVSLVVGWPTLRLKTHYFALATFGVAEIIRLIAMNWKDVTRGMDGISRIPPPTLGPVSISSDEAYYYLLVGFVCAAAVCYRRVLSSRYGRAFTAVRQGELAAELVGVNTTRIKLLAFALSGLYAGVAGGFHAHLFSVISPDIFSFENVSVPVLVALFVGGSGSVVGVAVGSATVVYLPELLRVLGQWYMMAYGAGILFLMAYAPDGLVGKVRRATRRLGASAPVGASDTEPIEIEDDEPWSNGPPAIRQDEPLLSVVGLTKRFGGLTAVENVSFELGPAEIKSIIGPNGAGKTTVLNLLTGVYRPDSGRVRFQGNDLVGLAPHRIATSGMLRTFQNIRIWSGLSVVENVMLSLHASSTTGLGGVLMRTTAARNEERMARKLAERALDLVGLWAERDLPAGSLSYGHRRLLELARCVVAKPKVILLDEPAAGLHEQECRTLLGRLTTIRDGGTAILLIEHNMSFVMAVSDTILVMAGARRIAHGTSAEIRSHSVVIEAYLGTDVTVAPD